MKHTIRLLSILTASGALLAGSFGCEQGFEPDEAEAEAGAEHVAVSAERHGGPRSGRMQEALGLDDSQREQARALREAMQSDLQPLEQQLREKEEQLRSLWTADAPDRAAILELSSQIDELRSSMRERQTAFRLAMHGLLTPEQRARFAEPGPGRGERRGGRGRPGPQGEPEVGDDGEPGERIGPPRGERAQVRDDGARPRRGLGPRGHGPGGPGGMMGGWHAGMAERLGLDETQQSQVQALADRMREASASAREQLDELREQERALWTAEQADARALGELHDRMDALTSAERERQVDFRLAVIQLLTPEQRARFAAAPRMGRGPRGVGMHEGRGMGRGHRMGMDRGPRPQADQESAEVETM